MFEENKSKSEKFELPEDCYCPITYDVMTNPVMATDGHSYEESAIRDWLKTHNTSPVTNKKLKSKRLTPNFTLKKTIEGFRIKMEQFEKEVLLKEDEVFAIKLQQKLDQKNKEETPKPFSGSHGPMPASQGINKKEEPQFDKRMTRSMIEKMKEKEREEESVEEIVHFKGNQKTKMIQKDRNLAASLASKRKS